METLRSWRNVALGQGFALIHNASGIIHTLIFCTALECETILWHVHQHVEPVNELSVS